MAALPLRGAISITRSSPTNWREAEEQVRAINGPALPDFSEEDWSQFARNLYCEASDGSLRLDYDANIAKPMDASQGAAVPPDLIASDD